MTPNQEHGVVRPVLDRDRVLAAWRQRIFRTFPAETATFLERETDPFRNPLGDRIAEGTARLLDGLLRGCAPAEMREAMDVLVRLRAVQGHPPSQALEFIFLLKDALRLVVGGEDAAVFDRRVDAMALVGFDAYARCREEIQEIRVRELRRWVALVLRCFSDACLGALEPGDDDLPCPADDAAAWRQGGSTP